MSNKSAFSEDRPIMAIIEGVAAKVTHTAGQTSAVATVYFGLTLNELGVLVGIVCSLVMAGANVFFTWRRDRREEREMLQRLREGA